MGMPPKLCDNDHFGVTLHGFSRFGLLTFVPVLFFSYVINDDERNYKLTVPVFIAKTQYYSTVSWLQYHVLAINTGIHLDST